MENIWIKLTRYLESIWLKYSPNTLIRGRILVPPVTQLFRSKWLLFFFQCSIQLNTFNKASRCEPAEPKSFIVDKQNWYHIVRQLRGLLSVVWRLYYKTLMSIVIICWTIDTLSCYCESIFFNVTVLDKSAFKVTVFQYWCYGTEFFN